MRTIDLTQDQIALIDDIDYSKVSAYKWHARKDGDVYYAATTINGSEISLHRFILNFPIRLVDHINRNPLDNRRENLRFCTKNQNAANRRIFSNNTSGRKGVVWHKRAKKWLARVQFNGKMYNLGYFDSLDNASIAYRKKAKELHGEFYYQK